MAINMTYFPFCSNKYNVQAWRPIQYAAYSKVTLLYEKPVKDNRSLWSDLSFSKTHSLSLLVV